MLPEQKGMCNFWKAYQSNLAKRTCPLLAKRHAIVFENHEVFKIINLLSETYDFY